MSKFKAIKKLTLVSLDLEIDIGEIIELDDKYAEKVNKDLKLTFPDVDAVLVPLDVAENVEVEKTKKTRRKKAVE